MSRLTPEQIAHQWVSTISDNGTVIGIAFGYDRIVKDWKPEQADELEAVGRLMIELAEQLRQIREGVPEDDLDASIRQLDRTS